MKRAILVIALLLTVFVTQTYAQDGSHTITFDNIRLTYPEALASSVQIEPIAAVPMNAEGMWIFDLPAHVRFTLLGYLKGPQVDQYYPLASQMFVLPTETFAEYEAGSYSLPTQKEFLQALLSGQGDLTAYAGVSVDAPDVFLPFVPATNARQVMRLHPQLVEFENGRGIRYLTYYSQGLNPITDSEIFYTFQGLTDDGRYYLSAVLPVRSGLLPEAVDSSNIDWDAFAARYRDYLAETAQAITDLPEDAFSPSLATLDALMQSFSISPSS